MIIENPAAFRFIIDEDLYLLDKDKIMIGLTAPEVVEIPPVVEVPEVAEIPLVVEAREVIAAPVIDFKYLGKHQKSFLIVVHYPDREFIDDAHLTALTNILKRKELALDDVAIFNLAAHNVTFEQVTAFFKPQKVLLMGKSTLLPGMEALTHNQPKQMNDCLFLYSFSFDEMMSSNDNKKTFWEQMKGL